MKRDFDRIREILLECEKSQESAFPFENSVSEFDRYQIQIMAEAGLVEISRPRLNSMVIRPGEVDYGLAKRVPLDFYTLTWIGHDYIEAIRSDSAWEKTKDGAASIGGATLGMMKDIAVAYLKQEASKKLGIEL